MCDDPAVLIIFCRFVLFFLNFQFLVVCSPRTLVAKRYTSRPVHTTYFIGNPDDPCGAQDETASCRTMSAGKKGSVPRNRFTDLRAYTVYIYARIYVCMCLYSYKRDRLCIMDLPKTWSIRSGAGVPCANTFRLLYWFPVDWNTNQCVCVCVYSNIILSNHGHCTCVRACDNRRGAAVRTSDWRRSNHINNRKYRFALGSLAHYYHVPTRPLTITSPPIHSPQRQRDMVIMIALSRPHTLLPHRKMK